MNTRIDDADEMNAGCVLPVGRALGCTYFTAVVHSDNSSIRVNSLAHVPVSILAMLFVALSTSLLLLTLSFVSSLQPGHFEKALFVTN